MTGTEITQVISNVGFPIAAFLLMFWQNTVIIQKNTEAMQGIREVLTVVKNDG